MKRIAVSLLLGVAFTLGALFVLALILYPGDQTTIGLFFLFWPVALIEKLGMSPDCANANLVAEKLTCARIGILAAIVAYPLIICCCSYIIHRVLFRFVRNTRLPDVG